MRDFIGKILEKVISTKKSVQCYVYKKKRLKEINEVLNESIEILSKTRKAGEDITITIEKKPALKERVSLIKNLQSIDHNLTRVENRLKVMKKIISYSNK